MVNRNFSTVSILFLLSFGYLQKGWLQSELASQIKALREVIGKYERNEAVPSLDTAMNISDAFEMSLDYLVDDILKPAFDRRIVERLEDFELLAEEDKITCWPCSMHSCAIVRPKKICIKKPPGGW